MRSDQPERPWLSVIMPTYRGERWIGAALNSLAANCAAQNAGGIELLVIDSSPNQDTLDIVRTFSDRLAIRVFERHDLTMWHTKTNFAVEAARADHVCWLHVDDIWLPGRAAAVATWIEQAPAAVLHLAPSAIIDASGHSLGIWRCPLPKSGELEPALLLERLLVQNFIAAPAPVFRRDAWLAAGGLDDQLWYTADWDIWLKLAALGTVQFHDSTTSAFRIHGHSLTATGSRHSADFSEQMRIVLERHLPRLSPHSRNTEQAGRASIAVNTALASAACGDFSRVLPAARDVLRLGPAGIRNYLRDSRLLDRVVPRLRAKLAGAL